MPNSFFQFKQFRIDQDRCGMKVTTDGCLLGAIVAEFIEEQEEPKRLLDIGTGTGLLSLMVAQATTESQIDAIEIDADAFSQASLNFSTSPWSDRLFSHHSAAQNFVSSISEPCFDLIISNPPFFHENSKGSDERKNLAVHNNTLPFSDLAQYIHQLLTSSGTAIIMYPEWEMHQFTRAMSQSGINPSLQYAVQDRSDSEVIRMITFFNRAQTEPLYKSLVIKDSDGRYSKLFLALLKEYYLHL